MALLTAVLALLVFSNEFTVEDVWSDYAVSVKTAPVMLAAAMIWVLNGLVYRRCKAIKLQAYITRAHLVLLALTGIAFFVVTKFTQNGLMAVQLMKAFFVVELLLLVNALYSLAKQAVTPFSEKEFVVEEDD